MIITIGDSHADKKWSNWKDIPNVKTNWIGAKLAHSIGRDGIDITKFEITKGDIVVFCFGEIDCRCHVHKYVNENNTYQHVIDKIVVSYIDSVKLNVGIIPDTVFCIYNVVPPVRKDQTNSNPEFPFLGTDEDRRKYHLYFNRKLKALCKENKFVFFDIYDKCCDEKGFLKKTMKDESVHLIDTEARINFIETKLLM